MKLKIALSTLLVSISLLGTAFGYEENSFPNYFPEDVNLATASAAECKKAKKHYDFYDHKMNRTLFSGVFASAVTGYDAYDSNKHDAYERKRDNAEEFLEVNSCSEHGIYK
jgi:hypothetical protein